MNALKLSVPVALVLGFAGAWVIAAEYAPTERKELKRADFVGNATMEITTAIMETKPGEEIPLHTHHGSEAGYVIQGAMIQPPGKEPIELKTGGDFLFARDVPHAGFKVVGDVPLRLFTVHVIDKGRPLSEIVAK